MPSKNKVNKQKEKEDEKEKAEQEKLLNEYWNEGTNKKGEKKTQLEHEKQMKKLQKKKDKKELEEADNSCSQGKPAKIKKNKNDDLEMLKEALKQAPKTKTHIQSEKKQQEKQKQKEENEKRLAQQKEENELLEKEKLENIQKGMVYDHDNIMGMEIHNNLEEDEEVITGMDNILDTFSSPENISYNSFYQQQLPIIKSEYPGLRLTQYQEKIHILWKKSPLNKNNQT